MPAKLTGRDSQALYFVKAIAIFSAVAAHASVISNGSAAIHFVTRLWDMFSCLSIGCFLITGGILYTRAPGDSARFWKHKAKTLILPWVFCSALTYLYRALWGYESSLLGYLLHMIGQGTWYYYVTIYLFMLAFFKGIYNRPAALWVCVGANAAVLTLRALGIDLFAWVPFSVYLNPFQWFGFFALGILLRRRELKLGKGFLAASCGVFAVAAVVVFRNSIFTYFHILNAVYSVSGFFVLLLLGRKLADTKGMAPIKEVGISTYCIYLLHMPIVQSVSRHLPESLLKHIAAPILGLLVMMALIELGKWITRMLPFGDKLRQLVGLR